MPAKTHPIALDEEQRTHLEKVAQSNKTSIRQRTHARILLLADGNQPGGTCKACKDSVICEKVRTSRATVERVRARFVQEGLQAALFHKAQQKRKSRVLDGAGEAHLVALVCGVPPEGRKRWSLRLLSDRLVEAAVVDAISHEAVRTTLKKRTQTMAEKGLVHSTPAECAVCSGDGGGVGCLSAAL